MDEAYEQALACEGTAGSVFTEDQWIAWEEQLALAPDVATKKQLVHGDKGRLLPDFPYRAAMCTLFEVQELLDEKTAAAAQKADDVLKTKHGELAKYVSDLYTRNLWRKAQRINYRRTMLELEAAIQLNKSKEEIQSLSSGMAVLMGVSLIDTPPADCDVQMEKEAPLPTHLDEKDLSTEAKLVNAIRGLKVIVSDYTAQTKVQELFSGMDLHARERFFAMVYRTSTQPSDLQLSAERHWMVLKLFLEDFAFECTDVDGYVDLIIEDLTRDSTTRREFGTREAHNRLSFPQLTVILQKQPQLVQESTAFAIRCVQLLQAVTKAEQRESLDNSDLGRDKIQYAGIERSLSFLTQMGPAVNSVRAALLHEQLQILRYQGASKQLWEKLVQYIQLPRFGADYVNIAHVNRSSGNELVVFHTSDPSLFGMRHGLNVQPTSWTFIESSSMSLGLNQISPSTDLQLIKDILHVLWAAEALSDQDESLLAQYLSLDMLNKEKPEFMVKSGCGELSKWIDKLPDKGQELSRWSTSTEISFCESSPKYFGPEDDLDVFIRVRNVKKLTVQLYEIRTIDYYSRVRHEIRGNICLDGLLPNEEQHIDLSHLSPWQEKRVPVKISSRTAGRRGVFVVEVFENGTTCRAILRKGFLRHVELVTARGHEFTVFDERGNVLKDASLKVMNSKTGRSRAQSPRTYHPDEQGTIVVPFRQADEASGDKFGILLCQGNFGFFSSSFRYLEARYNLQADMHVDTEQLRPGDVAQLVTFPQLYIQGTSVPISSDILTDVKVSVKFASVNTETSGSVARQVDRQFSSLLEFTGAKFEFEIPLDAASCNVELSARVASDHVKPASTQDLPVVRCQNTFQVQRINQFEGTYTPHFLRRATKFAGSVATEWEFYIAVLGHNGEAIKGKGVAVTLKHLHFSREIKQTLQTDSQGEIKLGALTEIIRVTAAFSNDQEEEWIWDVPNHIVSLPRSVNCAIGERVEVPLPFAYSRDIKQWVASRQILVCEVITTDSNSVLEDITNSSRLAPRYNTRNESIGVAFEATKSGKFVLFVRPLDLKYTVTVVKLANRERSASRGLLVEKSKILFETSTLPVSILSQEIVSEGSKKLLRVHVANALPSKTVVWLICKRFLSLSDQHITVMARNSGSKDGSSGLTFGTKLFDNEYLKKRKISDEYAYILQRRAFLNENPGSLVLLGSSSMPKPTLLQNPRILDQSNMEELVMRQGEKVTGFGCVEREMLRSQADEDIDAKKERRRQQVRYASRRSSKKKRSGGNVCSSSSISFLATPSESVVTGTLDEGGVATFPLSDMPFFAAEDTFVFEAIVSATDMASGFMTSREVQLSMNGDELAAPNVPKRDIRLSHEEALLPGCKSMQIQRHECLFVGDTRALARTFSSKYALYETMGSAIELWKTLCQDPLLPDLAAKLKSWSTLSKQAKIGFYFINASDDLNFFLFWKDREFFEKCVKQLVQGKLVKSLVDYYVLEDRVAISKRYLAPGVFRKLSVVEKLLVADRVESTETRRRICQHVIDEVDSTLGVGGVGSQLSRVFDTILSQGAVKPEEAPDLYGEVTIDESASFPPPGGGGFGSTGGFSFGGAPRAMAMQQQPMAARASRLSTSQPESAAFSFGAAMAAPAPMMMYSIPANDFEVIPESSTSFDVESIDSSDGNNSVDQDDDEEEEEVDYSDQSTSTDRKRNAQPYVRPGKVRRVGEKRFFGVQKPDLDGRNMFWRDYAGYIMSASTQSADKGLPFLSSHFPEALRSLTEGIFATSVLGLDIDAPATGIVQVSGGLRVRLEAASNVILYHQGVGEATIDDTPNSTLIVKEKIVLKSELATASEVSKLGSAREFVVNRVYSCVVTVSNITPSRLTNVNLLLQIPHGAIPLTESGFYTKNEIVEVAAHDTNTYTFDFYFPTVGEFKHYPAQASWKDKVIAWATQENSVTSITVVLKPSAVDLTSWNDVATRGSLDDVVKFMHNEKDVRKLAMDALLWRCQEEAFYTGLIQYLSQRYVFVEDVWKYSLKHGDVEHMSEFYSGSETFCRTIGAGVETSLASSMSPYIQERFEHALAFDHIEFGPFINRRAHRVSGKIESHFGMTTDVATSSSSEPARILNKSAREYYRTLCHILADGVTLSGEQLLVMSYFMILFNRIADAMKVFKRVEEHFATNMIDSTENLIAFDYIDSYLDFFRPQGNVAETSFPRARQNVSKYSKLFHDRWRLRFKRIAEVLSEYDELHSASLANDAHARLSISESDGQNPVQSSSIPSNEVRLDATVEGDTIQLKSQNVGACEISFYRIDVELMFSSEPFDSFSDAAASKSSLTLIEPWKQVNVEITGASSVLSSGETHTTSFKVPSDLVASQMLIRIRELPESRLVTSVAAPLDLTRSYFNTQLQVVTMSQAGILQVLHKGVPVSSCYVKVFAKTGSTSPFYKDGYTDVIGKFDYAAINGDLLTRVEKFSILVSHPKLGTTVQQVHPPVLATTSSEFQAHDAQSALWY
ncbi:hypothetical protein Poli38472_006031 [Pythium oligandrum]|uniref:Uncharacterized protein n=1 Tax=Pythium oligandrum TaxID=41045 RepID=A0A8K1FSH5_PYTOL|nr:hypothetical protein Poli38472_006031 [Pythium oligandrum]|eukprot:TMW68563.1 hypothetical protein Poli38472_006031 [Pythium oligandrum]